MRPEFVYLAAMAALWPKVYGSASWRKSLEHVVFFGDSFTDQSRAHSIGNGTYPGKYYKTIYPPDDPAAEGRVSWPRYFGFYSDLPYENYAVGGAVCNNDLTPGFNVPAVSGGQLAWFVEDHVLSNGTGHIPPKLDIPGANTLAIIWVGTNDLGLHSLLAPNATEGRTYWPNIPPLTPAVPPIAAGNDNATTMLDLADCQLGSLQKLYDYGVRNFLLLSTIPLHLTKLYSAVDDPMFQYANALNALLQVGVRSFSQKRDARIEYFDTYRFFEEIYLNPDQYFNGTAPANVTGHCHQCPNATDWRYCGVGDCTLEERDSYMWWDELHPSEQTGRLLAREIVNKLEGRSAY
ncbi:unnamed protein product [Clonostachys solani]|uniref:Uncharacterized protein n=1 Tax=Clonostachys solani TaxID=160281 RepID=A0A9N9YY29_9HYPO|nr:unnamed protein product [Clonostachys solani]